MLRFSFFATVLCFASLAACDGRTPVDPNLRFEGTYDLVSIDGKPLPYTVAMGREPTLIHRSSITLVADGRYLRSETQQYSFGPQTYADSGTYVLRGDSASLVPYSPNPRASNNASATLSDSAVVIRWQHVHPNIIGLPFVYRKR